jgi:hypothetical protein
VGDDPARGASRLAEVARTLETELKRVPGTRDVYTIGAPDRAVVVTLDAGAAGRLRLTPSRSGRRHCAPPTWCSRPASAWVPDARAGDRRNLPGRTPTKWRTW